MGGPSGEEAAECRTHAPTSPHHRPIRVLFFSEAVTLAHLVRPLLLARALAESGGSSYSVYFAAPHHYDFVLRDDERISRPGWTRLPLETRMPDEFSAVLERGGILFDEARIDRYVTEERSLIAKVKPDLVVGDLRPSLSVSAALESVPYWNITNAYWSPFVTPLAPPLPALAPIRTMHAPVLVKKALVRIATFLYRPFLPRILAAQGTGINAVRQRYGLAPFSDYLTGFTHGDTVLFADTPGIVPPRGTPQNYHYIGALSWSPSAALPRWWNALPADRPIVYVSLGSSGVLDSLPIVLSALARLDVTVVVTTAGRALPAGIDTRRIFVADFLPGPAMCRRAACVISNGGSPTSYQALTEGVPVVGIASNMDQLLSMSRVAATGAGILLRSDVLCEADVIRAIERILKSPRSTEVASLLARELQEFDAPQRFLKLVEHTSKERRGLPSEEIRKAV